ncbi:MAG: hypothetical protein V1870_04280 [Candidatus Aenigmatarchaeota archaeon]
MKLKLTMVLLVIVLFCSIGYSLIADRTDVSVYEGWNLISPPYSDFIIVKNSSDFSYYDDCNISVIYYYNTSSRKYVKINASEDMMGGFGYWVYSINNCSIGFSGYDYVVHDATQLKRGWNTLGGTELFNINDYIGDCVIGNVYGYDAFEKIYFTTDFLQKGHGYWIRVNNDCKLGEPKPPAYLVVANKDSLTDAELSFYNELMSYSDPQLVEIVDALDTKAYPMFVADYYETQTNAITGNAPEKAKADIKDIMSKLQGKAYFVGAGKKYEEKKDTTVYT